MNTSHEPQPIRENVPGWTTIVTGDNGVELLEHRIKVTDFSQAVEVANKIAPLVMRYEPLDSDYTLRVNLTRWAVESRLSVPTGCWESEAQEKLAKGIAEISV
jgi:hypothetical protein